MEFPICSGINRWWIILADSEGFQQSLSASAAEVRGRLNWQMQNLKIQSKKHFKTLFSSSIYVEASLRNWLVYKLAG